MLEHKRDPKAKSNETQKELKSIGRSFAYVEKKGRVLEHKELKSIGRSFVYR